MNRPIIIGIVLFLLALGALLIVMKRPARQAAATPPPVASPTATPAPSPAQSQPTERRINVLLFFNDKGSSSLITENRFVPYREELRDQAFEVMEDLTLGSSDDLVPTIPEGTKVRDLFITRDGVAYVDFSAELASKHAGGSLAEINTVYSIVNTLTLNFPQIKKVQILVDDRAVDTLTGHLDLSRPLGQDLSMVSNEPAAPDTPQTSM